MNNETRANNILTQKITVSFDTIRDLRTIEQARQVKRDFDAIKETTSKSNKPHTTDILYCCECDKCQADYKEFNEWLESH